MLTTSFENRRDDSGHPLCPVCDRAIRPGESVARVVDYMVHLDCFPEARVRFGA